MEGLSIELQQPEFVHVALNHFPITVLFIGLVCLMVAVWLKDRTTLVVSQALIALLSFSAWPVAHLGERAYDRAVAMTDDAGDQYLKHHEKLADRWIFLFYSTSVAAVGGACHQLEMAPIFETGCGCGCPAGSCKPGSGNRHR